jgi:hypothetical protein
MEQQYGKDCPICGNKASIQDALNGYFGLFVNCSICGKFFVESDCYSIIKDEIVIQAKERSCLFWYMNHVFHTQDVSTTRTIFPHFHKNSSWGRNISIEENGHQIIHIDNVLEYYPRNFSERIDRMLMNLSLRCKDVSGEISFMDNSVANNQFLWLDTFTISENQETANNQLRDYLVLLEQLGFVHCLNSRDTLKKYKMTAKGWMKIQELQSSSQIKRQCFVAMWFDPSMQEARKIIVKAIQDSGYSPMIIDIKEHNNQIVPEIFYEIKQSRFVIADLTGQRNGVYYEAGYAEALGKPVILMCKDTSDSKPHFDVAQKNTIFWKDENDAYERLVKRIRATVE